MISKNKIYRILGKQIINKTNCKYLQGKSRAKFFLFFRDRAADQSYYLITIKGNYIRAYTIKYINSQGVGINAFLSISIPCLIGEKPEEPVELKKLIAKEQFKNYQDFIANFISLTPALEWDE